MSLFESYDDSEEIVKPEILTKGQIKLPETAIVCFKKDLMDYLATNDNFEEYSYIDVGGDKMKIYKTIHNGKEIAIMRTLMGGPATAAMMEEFISRGVRKFIYFGCCGSLTNDVENGAFIIPNTAYRDEGTSYHYLPVNDFIEVETAKHLSQIFEKNGIKYINTKTWTTDALYKETINKSKKRVSEGCKVVEMECASIMAVSQVRNVKAYIFFYSDDTLEGGKWDIRTLKSDRSIILKECLNIALKVTEDI